MIEVRLKDASVPDAGAAPLPPDDPSDKKPKKPTKKRFDNAVPKALLEFNDVSNDADGDYEASINWGKPAPTDKVKDTVRAAVNGQVKAAIQATIATVVAEFMAK